MISLGFVEGKRSPKAFTAKVRGLVRQCWMVTKKVRARATVKTVAGAGKKSESLVSMESSETEDMAAMVMS